MSTYGKSKLSLLGYEKVVDGPSREEMFDSLRLARSTDTAVEFSFRPRNDEQATPIVVRGRILRIELEDGSGQSWNIVFRPDELVGHGMMPAEPYLPIYYRTDQRSGGIVPASLLAR